MLMRLPGRLAVHCGVLLLALLANAGATRGQEPICTDCHDAPRVASSIHSDLGCADCHTNVTRVPHGDPDQDAHTADALCAECHEPDAGFGTSVHAELGCQDCHGPGHAISAASGALCADCHADVAETLEHSVHAGTAECQSCHGDAHAILGRANLASPVSPVKQIQSCGQCHDAWPEVMDGYLTSVHARALLVAGLISAPACSDCHGSHRILPPSDADAATSHAKVPETCGSCHVLILKAWSEQSAHGRAWRQGEQGPVCTTCHVSHAITDPTAFPTRLAFPEHCGGCHDQWYLSFRDTFHGKSTELGFMASAICSDCHTPHRDLPADDPRSSVHPANLAATCGSCHGEVPAAFLSFDPHNDPSDPGGNLQIHYTWLFMTGLLLTVFGFFSIHDLLWLQRSLVGAARGEFAARGTDEGPHIRRFSAVHIRVHVVIIITFLLLAATGLPLKFHSAGWAQVLVNLFGGLDSARTLHRAAAVATFGYALFHLGYLVYRAVSGKAGSLLWGFASLVPQPRDIAHLLRNLRYFLYLGPRPAADRWTYWEKFDYLAVFWGVAIIGLSGLALWFPEFFSRFLPGWTLNAAYIIHSDEALLATGFIFIFHFLHTHLQPWSFPMDPVIFTGRIPLARFKEERPLEYQRLRERGQLDERLVDPPTRDELRRAYLFGFTALAIGIALATAIFWTILTHTDGQLIWRDDAIELLRDTLERVRAAASPRQ